MAQGACIAIVGDKQGVLTDTSVVRGDYSYSVRHEHQEKATIVVDGNMQSIQSIPPLDNNSSMTRTQKQRAFANSGSINDTFPQYPVRSATISSLDLGFDDIDEDYITTEDRTEQSLGEHSSGIDPSSVSQDKDNGSTLATSRPSILPIQSGFESVTRNVHKVCGTYSKVCECLTQCTVQRLRPPARPQLKPTMQNWMLVDEESTSNDEQNILSTGFVHTTVSRDKNHWLIRDENLLQSIPDDNKRTHSLEFPPVPPTRMRTLSNLDETDCEISKTSALLGVALDSTSNTYDEIFEEDISLAKPIDCQECDNVLVEKLHPIEIGSKDDLIPQIICTDYNDSCSVLSGSQYSLSLSSSQLKSPACTFRNFDKHRRFYNTATFDPTKISGLSITSPPTRPVRQKTIDTQTCEHDPLQARKAANTTTTHDFRNPLSIEHGNTCPPKRPERRRTMETGTMLSTSSHTRSELPTPELTTQNTIESHVANSSIVETQSLLAEAKEEKILEGDQPSWSHGRCQQTFLVLDSERDEPPHCPIRAKTLSMFRISEKFSECDDCEGDERTKIVFEKFAAENCNHQVHDTAIDDTGRLLQSESGDHYSYSSTIPNKYQQSEFQKNAAEDTAVLRTSLRSRSDFSSNLDQKDSKPPMQPRRRSSVTFSGETSIGSNLVKAKSSSSSSSSKHEYNEQGLLDSVLIPGTPSNLQSYAHDTEPIKQSLENSNIGTYTHHSRNSIFKQSDQKDFAPPIQPQRRSSVEFKGETILNNSTTATITLSTSNHTVESEHKTNETAPAQSWKNKECQQTFAQLDCITDVAPVCPMSLQTLSKMSLIGTNEIYNQGFSTTTDDIDENEVQDQETISPLTATKNRRRLTISRNSTAQRPSGTSFMSDITFEEYDFSDDDYDDDDDDDVNHQLSFVSTIEQVGNNVTLG